MIGFDDASVSPRKVRFMVRGESGELVESPAALALDAIADVDATLGGAQSTTAVASSPNRIAVALVDPSSAATEGGDVLVRFFDQNRSAEGPPVRCTDAQTGAQTEPAVALTSGGAAMVVFADSAAGGVTARHFANGSTTPSGGEVVVGSGASAPDVAAHASGFVVALQVGGNIMFQRFQENGSPVDAAPQMVGTGSAPRVAALADGRFMIAWNDGGVVARAFGADGTPSTDKLMVASGDNVDVAAGAERFLVSFLSGTVMARVYDGAGELALNHESPPSTDAFMVGSGTDPVAAGGRDFIAVGFAAGGDISARLFPVP